MTAPCLPYRLGIPWAVPPLQLRPSWGPRRRGSTPAPGLQRRACGRSVRAARGAMAVPGHSDRARRDVAVRHQLAVGAGVAGLAGPGRYRQAGAGQRPERGLARAWAALLRVDAWVTEWSCTTLTLSGSTNRKSDAGLGRGIDHDCDRGRPAATDSPDRGGGIEFVCSGLRFHREQFARLRRRDLESRGRSRHIP